MTNNKNLIQQVLDLLSDKLPVLSLLAIVIGYTNLNSYYQQFNIDIVQYMSFTDSLIVFAKISLYIAFLAFSSYVFAIVGSIFWYSLIVFFKVENSHKFYNRIRTRSLLASSIMFLFYLGILAIFWFNPIKYLEDKTFIIILLITLGLLSAVTIRLEVVKNYLNKEMIIYEDIESDLIIPEHYNFKFAFAALSIAVILLVSYYGQLKAEKLKKHSELRNTLLTLEDRTIYPFKDEYYIGKTESFIFVYNSKDSSSSAIKIDKIKSITHFANGYFNAMKIGTTKQSIDSINNLHLNPVQRIQ